MDDDDDHDVDDHDVDDHDDHRDDCEREGSDPPPLHPGRQLTLVFHLSSLPVPRSFFLGSIMMRRKRGMGKKKKIMMMIR